jgi:hypothetical protein
MITTDAITPELEDEFARGVRWLQDHGRPELSLADAVVEAIEDWVAELRAEHLRGAAIPDATR